MIKNFLLYIAIITVMSACSTTRKNTNTGDDVRSSQSVNTQQQKTEPPAVTPNPNRANEVYEVK